MGLCGIWSNRFPRLRKQSREVTWGTGRCRVLEIVISIYSNNFNVASLLIKSPFQNLFGVKHHWDQIGATGSMAFCSLSNVVEKFIEPNSWNPIIRFWELSCNVLLFSPVSFVRFVRRWNCSKCRHCLRKWWMRNYLVWYLLELFPESIRRWSGDEKRATVLVINTANALIILNTLLSVFE